MVIGQLFCVRNVCPNSKKSTCLKWTGHADILVTIIDTGLSTLYLTASVMTIASLKSKRKILI